MWCKIVGWLLVSCGNVQRAWEAPSERLPNSELHYIQHCRGLKVLGSFDGCNTVEG